MRPVVLYCPQSPRGVDIGQIFSGAIREREFDPSYSPLLSATTVTPRGPVFRKSHSWVVSSTCVVMGWPAAQPPSTSIGWSCDECRPARPRRAGPAQHPQLTATFNLDSQTRLDQNLVLTGLFLVSDVPLVARPALVRAHRLAV